MRLLEQTLLRPSGMLFWFLQRNYPVGMKNIWKGMENRKNTMF
jgi:hypothetical protein